MRGGAHYFFLRGFRVLRVEIMIQQVTGVILAGGKSTRVGQNKALLPYRGRSLIESVIETMASVFSRVVLSVHQPDSYPQLQLPEIVDRYPEIGPMGGITSVLESGESRIFCVGCDMPFLNADLIQHLCSFDSFDAVIPVWQDRPQVLHALYSQSLLSSFQESITANRYRITDALENRQVLYLFDVDEDGRSFQNLNTPADYDEVVKNR